MYLKTKGGIVFLTQFNPLAVDIDGKPIAISMEMAYRINICSKMYKCITIIRKKKFPGMHFLEDIAFPKNTAIIMIGTIKSLKTIVEK